MNISNTTSRAAGQVFGRLTIMSMAGVMAHCICECGGKRDVAFSRLKSGNTRSCGCLSLEQTISMGKSNTVHGMKGTATYYTWQRIRQRCNNPRNKSYKHYGGRGIYVCERWNDFSNFYADMGEKPEGLSIERIDNDGPYNKENCKWADAIEQTRNRSITLKVQWHGQERILADLIDDLGLEYAVVYPRVKEGRPLSECLQPRVQPYRSHVNKRQSHSARVSSEAHQ